MTMPTSPTTSPRGAFYVITPGDITIAPGASIYGGLHCPRRHRQHLAAGRRQLHQQFRAGPVQTCSRLNTTYFNIYSAGANQ